MAIFSFYTVKYVYKDFDFIQFLCNAIKEITHTKDKIEFKEKTYIFTKHTGGQIPKEIKEQAIYCNMACI